MRSSAASNSARRSRRSFSLRVNRVRCSDHSFRVVGPCSSRHSPTPNAANFLALCPRPNRLLRSSVRS